MIVGKAAEHHEDVGRAVRLAATRGSGDLSQLKAEIDRGLRTSRYLGYRESGGWAMQARPVVEAIGEAVGSSPTAELVLLIERAIGHVVKVILKADDSDGMIGDLARGAARPARPGVRRRERGSDQAGPLDGPIPLRRPGLLRGGPGSLRRCPG